MSERGVRVVFSRETRSTGSQNHSNIGTNERTSRARRTARTGPGNALRATGDLALRLRKRMPDANGLRRIRTVFAMLADQQRLKIMLALTAAEELCVGEVADVLGTSVSVASHHLRKLRDLGILADRDDGKLTCYSLRQRFVARLAVIALAGSR